jgi:glucose/mannose-6-phosphate isomerase
MFQILIVSPYNVTKALPIINTVMEILMLDDLKLIHERDPQDALGVAEKQWKQLEYQFEIERVTDKLIANVVLAGMGGSALPGVLLSSWARLSVPFEISRDYRIPQYVGPQTLFISSSYSGNTEETLEALAAAEAAGAQIVVVSAGGKLAELAHQKGYPLVVIPAGIQPRMSSLYFLNAFIEILEPLNVVPKGSAAELKAVVPWLRDELALSRPDVPTSQNSAKQTALDIVGKTVIMYSGPLMFPAANKWKICLNENAKNLAWVNQYPEFNHNEFTGWSGQPLEKPFVVIEIQSNLEHPRVQKRFVVSAKLLSGRRPAPIVITLKGDTLIKQLMWAVTLGDFTSIYLAILGNINPTPVDLVEKIKIELG